MDLAQKESAAKWKVVGGHHIQLKVLDDMVALLSSQVLPMLQVIIYIY